MSDTATDAPIPELSAQDRLNSLTPEARATWDMTGEWPDPAKVTTTEPAAEPEPDDEPEPEPAAVVAEPAPAEAGKLAADRREGKVTRQQQINDLIRKSTEADLRARALEAEISALKAGKAEPKAEPAAKTDDFTFDEPRPTEDKFETYADFTEALADWTLNKREAKAAHEADKTRKAQAETKHLDDLRTRQNDWARKRDAFAATTPEFAEKAMPFLGTVDAGTPIGDAILDSDHGPQLALYLATHPDEADRIARLAPLSAIRALGKLEAQFDSPTTSTSASAGPAAKTVTTAPAPPTTLAARSASPADPSAAAFARGDFVAWEAEENRKALAANR